MPERPVIVPPRLKRTLELVFHVEGVVAARVWRWTDSPAEAEGQPGATPRSSERVAVGIRANAQATPGDVLRRVEAAVEGMRQPGEAWTFGLLDAS